MSRSPSGAAGRPPGRTWRGLLLTLALWPAAATAQAEWARYPAVLAPCETARVDAGKPEARWAFVDGVHQDERDRRGDDWAWTRRSWRARLLLTSTGERTLTLTGRRGPLPRLDLRLFWNGADLGRREVAAGLARITWTVPAERTRIGINELRFAASTARELDRELAFKLDRLDLQPAGPDCGPVETATAGDGFRLAPGTALLLHLRSVPRAALELQLGGEPGARVEVLLSRDGEPQRRTDLTVDPARPSHRLDLGNLLSNEAVAIARGPGTLALRLHEFSSDERPAAWRVACGLWWKEPLAAAALLTLLAAAVAIGRRWPGGRGAPWLDCALLLGLALAVRFAYLAAYPEMDPGRFGDAWEYLRRSRDLAQGASFWTDISWHAWLSWIRPPGYYVFLAAILGGSYSGLHQLAEVQAVLLAAAAAATYLTAYPLFGRGAALAAGLLLAVYPQTITSASWILSDPLSLFLTSAALAGLAWAATTQRWPVALAAGIAFGLACLVRSAPLYYVPLAALLLLLARRPPRRRAPAAALLGATLVIVLPWCVRNSMLYGKPMGIDDLVIPNFLMAHPDPEILPRKVREGGVWGVADPLREEYFKALWRANKDAQLTLASGSILGRGLVRMAASPGATLQQFGLHMKIYFRGFPRSYAAHYLDEIDGCRVSSWTDALNLIYLATLILALPGVVLALRRRSAWPLVAWVLYFVVVTNLFFYPSYMPGRYRLPIYPVLAVLAGLGVSWLGGLLADRLGRRRRAGGA